MIEGHVKTSSAVEESPAKDVGPKEPPGRSDHEIDPIGPTPCTKKLSCLDFSITVQDFELMGEAVKGIMEDYGSVDPSTSGWNAPYFPLDLHPTVRVDSYPATGVSSEKLEPPLRKPASVFEPTVEIKDLS
jgi:hypothetical protein